MRVKPICFSVAAVLIAGCSPPKSIDWGSSTLTARSCQAADNDADCTIVVDVSANAQGTNCEVKVLSSQMNVGFKKNAKDKWIEWAFSGSSLTGAKFVSKGIDPKLPQANIDAWNANFRNGGADHGGRQFKWKNQNDPGQAGKEYEYLVKVEVPRPGGVTWTCTQDPVIKNQA